MTKKKNLSATKAKVIIKTHESLSNDSLNTIFGQLNSALVDLGYHDIQLSQVGIIKKFEITNGCRMVEHCVDIPGPNGTTLKQCTQELVCD